MIVVLSGEGPTDLGQCGNAQSICEEGDFQIGPMTVLLDKMLESHLDYSLLTVPGGYKYVSEGALGAHAKERKEASRRVFLRGKKAEQETGYFFISSWILADIAMQIERESNVETMAVLFRDCDGTRSSTAGLWQAKWESMLNGFARGNYARGVPMIPKPKSEAWLICAAKPTPQNCAYLENISGNDNSPNSAKAQLDNALGSHNSREELCEWLSDTPLCERLPSMPSFMMFKTRLNEVVAELKGAASQ